MSKSVEIVPEDLFAFEGVIDSDHDFDRAKDSVVRGDMEEFDFIMDDVT